MRPACVLCVVAGPGRLGSQLSVRGAGAISSPRPCELRGGSRRGARIPGPCNPLPTLSHSCQPDLPDSFHSSMILPNGQERPENQAVIKPELGGRRIINSSFIPHELAACLVPAGCPLCMGHPGSASDLIANSGSLSCSSDLTAAVGGGCSLPIFSGGRGRGACALPEATTGHFTPEPPPSQGVRRTAVDTEAVRAQDCPGGCPAHTPGWGHTDRCTHTASLS